MAGFIKRRDFLLGGTAALASTAALAQSITPQIGGGIGQGFDGGLAGAGKSTPGVLRAAITGVVNFAADIRQTNLLGTALSGVINVATTSPWRLASDRRSHFRYRRLRRIHRPDQPHRRVDVRHHQRCGRHFAEHRFIRPVDGHVELRQHLYPRTLRSHHGRYYASVPPSDRQLSPGQRCPDSDQQRLH